MGATVQKKSMSVVLWEHPREVKHVIQFSLCQPSQGQVGLFRDNRASKQKGNERVSGCPCRLSPASPITTSVQALT